MPVCKLVVHHDRSQKNAFMILKPKYALDFKVLQSHTEQNPENSTFSCSCCGYFWAAMAAQYNSQV